MGAGGNKQAEKCVSEDIFHSPACEATGSRRAAAQRKGKKSPVRPLTENSGHHKCNSLTKFFASKADSRILLASNDPRLDFQVE